MADLLTIRLELARAEEAGDPHAFRTGPQDYILRWEGGDFEQARLVWDDALQQDLADVRLPGRDPELVRRLGARVRRFLEPTRFRDQAARIAAAADAGQPVHLDIVSAAAELYSLPWELLSLDDGRHLGELADLVIQYRWPRASPAPPARDPRPEGGRLLFAWSRAFGGVGEGPALAAIEAAARAGHVGFDRARDVLADVSLAGLVAALERRLAEPDPPTILHILAHGAPIGRGYGLGLGDGRGGREVVDSAALRRALAPFAPQLRLVVLMTCDGGNPGALGSTLGSCVQELHRAGFEAVVGSRYPLAGPAAVEFTGAFYGSLFDRTCAVDQAFAAARARLARGTGLDWASVALHGHAPAGRGCRPLVFRPYRGLLAFEREHTRFFFGRDDERREAVADLRRLVDDGRPRLLVVAGASGTGKSSVVLAGVVPDVQALGWTTAIMRPGLSPMRALDDALTACPASDGPFLLVVDQFEEVFTHAGDGDEPAAFARRLWDLAREADARARVLLTLRVDYLGRCGEVVLDDAGLRLDKIAYDERHRLFVAQMSPERLAETITGPSARVGLSLEAGLDSRLLGEIGGDPVGLPLLQYALDELWQRRRGDTLTHAALDAIGGVVGALAKHADAAVDALAPAGQAQARRALVRLVAYGADPSTGTRRRELEGELRPERAADEFDRAVAALVDARLLVRRTEADGRVTLEVAHEALIRNWDRLWQWYEQDRAALARQRELDEIVAQAAQHNQLLTGNLLAATEALVQQLGDDADADARDLVRRSRAAAERAEMWVRLIRVGIVSSLAVTLLVVYLSRERVAAEAQLADDARRRSEDIARLSIAFAQTYEQPVVSAALLREVVHTDLRGWRQVAFTTTLALQPERVLRPPALGGPAPVTAAALSPDGAELITGHGDGAVRLWPLAGDDRSPLVVRPGQTGGGRAIDQLDVRRALGGYTVLAASQTAQHAWLRGPQGSTPLFASERARPDGERMFLGPSQLVLTLAPKRSVDGVGRGDTARIARLEGGALRPPHLTRDRCTWVDPSVEQLVCADEHGAPQLLRWSDGSVVGPIDTDAAHDRGLSPAASLFATRIGSGLLDLWLVDPERRIARTYVEDAQLRVAGRDIFTILADERRLCRQPRDAGPSRCATLPTTCGAPALLAAHADIGALVQCGQLQWILADALVDQGEADILYELAPPPTALAGVFFTPPGDHLIAVTRDAQQWHWDLRDPPAGWLAHAVAPHDVAALVPGTAALLELSPLEDGAELRLLRWDRPTAPPQIARVSLGAPSGRRQPCCLVAGRDVWLAGLMDPGAPERSGELDLDILSGPLAPLAAPRASAGRVAFNGLARPPLGVARGAAIVPRTADLDLIPLGGPPGPARPLAAPRVRDAHGERHDVAVAIAAHPTGRHAVVAYRESPAVLVRHADASVTPLPSVPGPVCGETDVAALVVSAAAYAPNGRWLALGYASGRVEVWPTTDDGQLDRAGRPHALCRVRAPQVALAFSPDGASLLSSTATSNLTIWHDFADPDALPEPLTLWLPARPRLRDVAIGDGRVTVLTEHGRLWFGHATFDRDGLRARLARTPGICLTSATRVALLNDDPASAEAAAAKCMPSHVLRDRSGP